jgi:hypothetical protein
MSSEKGDGPGLAPYVWAFVGYLLPAFSIPGFGPYLGGFVAGAVAGYRVVRAPKDMLAALAPAVLGAGAFAWWANSSVDPDAAEAALTAVRIMNVIAVQSVLLAAVAAALGAALGYQMRGGAKGE